MSFVAYPDAADIEALMKSTGYWPTGEGAAASNQIELARLQCLIAAEAAIDEWEHSTGWTPFLSDGTTSARVFDQIDTSGLLDFEGGALAISSVAINGTPQTVGQQYHLYPKNAIERKQAITGLDFGSGRGSFANWPGGFGRGSIEVVAQWGRVAEVPGDVWQAIQQKAASIVLIQIPNLQSIASISQDGFSKAYDVVGIVTQKDLAAGGAGGAGIWGRSFDVIANRWKRVTC